MNRRDYFLDCLNVHFTFRATAMSVDSGRAGHLVARDVAALAREVAAAQGAAWRIPEEAIPQIDPARAALDFYDYLFGSDVAKPTWLHAWEESLGSK